MASNPTQESQQAHVLLDPLPEEKLAAVRNLLRVMVEPLSSSLAAGPLDDEEITAEATAAVECARASLARDEGIPHEEVLREFGLRK